MNPRLGDKIMALLAFLQGMFGLLRAYGWIQIGVDLFKEGFFISPAVGAVAVFRGLLIAVVACLYFLFCCGVLLGSGWAWWVCFTAVLINVLLILNAVGQGVPTVQAIVWTVIPAVLILYRLSTLGRQTLNAPPAAS